jgi:hypothetical protein
VALGHVADRHRDGAAAVGDVRAAGQAVGGLQGDRADHVVTQVLGDLEGHGLGDLGQIDLHRQGVEQRGHRVAGELHVDDGADHPHHAAGRRLRG